MTGVLLIFVQYNKPTCSIKMYSSRCAANIVEIIEVVLGVVFPLKKFMDP